MNMKNIRVLKCPDNIMKSVNKDKLRVWVDALKSGEYRQAIGWLSCSAGFCVYGVMCDVSGVGEWNYVGEKYGLYSVPSTDPYQNASATQPPKLVAEWVGIPHGILSSLEVVEYKYNGFCYGIIGMNDSLKMSFKQIAKVLTKYFEL